MKLQVIRREQEMASVFPSQPNPQSSVISLVRVSISIVIQIEEMH